jgi:2'-5' RNA ligase
MADSGMADRAEVSQFLSVHILLPEAVDRRLARWAEDVQGASWPAWGGHITLVPRFVPRGSSEEVRAIIEQICLEHEPFRVRFTEPVAAQDPTRPDYFAVLLNVEIVDPPASGSNEAMPDGESVEDGQNSRLHQLRRQLLAALEPLREDMMPQLVQGPYMPHVTLALGVSESEARVVVRKMRADSINAEFQVDVIWLLTQFAGQSDKFERQAIPLGRVSPVEFRRD